ncbi:hypothetical protein C0580_01515 [Candidatus Parcubacteria bacterium]|nr:MAG: hypothetical protein C0580_01515 [Candidatus Parcubacteria bacterium]
MYEDPQKILNYLPIRKNKLENDYIEHLWNAFLALETSESTGKSFSIMPFHLLFMLALQYKILRISQIQTESCNLFFCGVAGRSKDVLLSDEKSVFDIALINERTIPEIFQLVGLDTKGIKSIKDLIDQRNNTLAHAKGGIEIRPEEKVDKYIKTLEAIQKSFSQINQDLINTWLYDIQGCEDAEQYLENNFLIYRLTYRDFSEIIKILLGAPQLDFDQWEQVVNKGLELIYDQTIEALKIIAKDNLDKDKVFNAVKVLEENGEL